jgi:non-heme chloroperoxidase
VIHPQRDTDRVLSVAAARGAAVTHVFETHITTTLSPAPWPWPASPVPPATFSIVADRYTYFQDFLDNFYNVDKLGGTRISDRAWQNSFIVASGASPYATYACVDTWLTDFRADLPKIDVPTLVVHGTEDRILPFEATAKRLPGLIKDLTLVPVDGGPHNIGWTYPDEVNAALLDFLSK